LSASSQLYELIRLTASTAEHRRAARQRLDRLAAEADWVLVEERLRLERLLATLGPRLLETAPGAAPEPFAAAVEAAIASARHNDALLTLIGERAREQLRASGIVSCALKGPGLGEAIYGEPGRRLASDIDLLVAPADLHAAVAAIRELGYAEPNERIAAPALPELHYAMRHERDQLPPIELHWRIHWYESRFASERLLPPAGAAADWRPAPVDELAALLLFYARDGFTGLRQAVDLSAWWDRFGAQLPAAALEPLTREYPQLREALLTALTVAEAVVGLPAGRVVAGPGRLRRRSRLATSLVDHRPYRNEAQLFAEVALVDGLLTPRGGLRAYLRRQVLPSAELRRQRSGGKPIYSKAGYGARVLARQALALCSVAHIPGATSIRLPPA
jgi:hypothetical protein